MKKILTVLTLSFVIFLLPVRPARAQATELAQLALNIEKLAQLKKILQNMYDGYEILTKGYNTVKDLAEGNFSLHKVFLDGLLQVSPTVQKYKKVADIISNQQRILKEYKAALAAIKAKNIFTGPDLRYVENVYKKLFDRTLDDLKELLMIITAGELRMNDAERITAIDRIDASMNDKLLFVRSFNQNTLVLASQKEQGLQDTKLLEELYFKR